MPERGRRRFLKAVPGTLLALELADARGGTLVGVRVWPARDYTRVTLELDEPLKTSHFTVSDPPRLVVDLEGIELDAPLREIVAKVKADDPYIASVRVGQNRPRVARLVFDLKAPVEPQVFTVAPVAAYRHRLVLDLHPVQPPDPLAELIARGAGRGDAARPGAPGRSEPPDAAPGATPTPALPAGAPAAAASSRTAPPPAVTPSVAAPAVARDAPAIARARDGDDPLADLIREREAAVPVAARDARPTFDRLVTVAIDPGHGGEDPGAIGKHGTLEKDVVLAIALKLRDRIDATPGMRAYMTRESDFFVPLATRVAKARAVRADLFVSVHADAFVLPQARGSSVFVLSERSASSVGARWLASRENRADLIGGVGLPVRNREVAKLLLELSTTAQIRESRRFGGAVLGELRSVGDLHKVSIEQAAFAVLRAPDIPSILVETAFISNPDEERKLRNPRWQAKLADAMHAGILRYFRRNPPGPRGATA